MKRNNQITGNKYWVSLLFIICSLFTTTAGAQTPLRGRVLDAATGQPLPGVIVSSDQLKGYSTLTDEEGRYELLLPDYCSAINFSAPDFNTVVKGIGRDSIMPDVRLYPATLSDFATGTPTAHTSPYTSALTIEDELQHQLGALVHTTGRSGTPGIGSVMFIEGLGSLNANAQPLIVVDGVIYDQQRDRQMLHGGFFNNVLSNISPADIEQVQVLRNGTALYGAKGSNGVILIQTRRNKSMATRITASISGGVTFEPRFIDMMGAEQYRSYASELLKTTNTTVSDFKFLNEDPNYHYYRQYHNDTDWKDEVYRMAFTQNYGINVEGGDDVANYNLSLGYVNAQSTLDYNAMNRLNVRFNTDIKFSDRFFTRFDASFSNLSRNLRDDGTPSGYDNGPISSPSFLAYAKSPFLSPFAYAGGQLSDHLDVNDEAYLDEALHNYQTYNWRLGNPYALNVYGDAENKNRFQNSMLNIAVTPRFDFNASLSLSEHFSYNLVSTNEKYYIPIYGTPDYYVQSLASTRENESRSLFSKQNSVMSDTRLQWRHRYGAHNINAFGGARINWESFTLDTQLGYDTGNDKTPFIQSGPNSTADGNSASWTTISWYAQAQYDYLQRYFLQLNLTADTSSDYGLDADGGLKAFGARWGLFPGVQVGWVLTSEPWFARVPGIDYLRLNAGFDITGNDDINHLAARSYFSSEQYMGAVTGLSLGNIGNSRLQWERTRKFHVGLDGNFLDNRLSVHLNIFSSKTDNLLTLQRLSYLTGLDTNWRNGGAMTNKGVDLSLTGRIIVTRDWQWEVGASMGHYNNKVTELPASTTPDGLAAGTTTSLYGATILTAVGQAANVFYGYRAEGVFATTEEAAAANLCIVADNGVDRNYFQAGDVRFADLDHNGIINDADRTIIGDPNPDIYGNITTSLNWKRWRLDAALTYSLGNDIYNYQRSQLEGGSRFMNQTIAMTRRWHGEGHVTDMPRITFQDPMGNARFSDRWIEDGSYLKLSTVTLSYRLPVNSQFLQGLEFWVQGNNLLTFTGYLGGDPETAITSGIIGQGIDTGLLPQSRSVLAGVKINL
ncbi:MAG: SusC/RagA family TonB-linked outer membrane protein [Prevotella sp.]|nr:SusC/RagA family TonB-linked outer membrane protein [Prevotella sp.]